MGRPTAILLAALLALLLMVLAGAAVGDARPTKSRGPTSLTEAFGTLWVGDGNGRLWRIDSRTHEVQGKRMVGRYVWSLAVGHGSLWIAVDGMVQVLDPATRQSQPLPVAVSGVTALASTARGVWAGSSSRNEVVRIASEGNSVRARLRLRDRFWGLWAHRTGVWLQVLLGETSNASKAVREIRTVDETHNRLLPGRYQLRCDAEVAVIDSAAWVFDPCRETLKRLEVRGRATTFHVDLTPAISAVAVGFGSVWVASHGGDVVARISPATGEIKARIPIEAPSALAVGKRGVWVATLPSGVRFIDPRTNRASPVISLR